MSNCRSNRCYDQKTTRPGGYDRRCGYNRSGRYGRSDVMGDRRVHPGGERCPYRTPRAWQNTRYDRPCR